MSASGFSTLRVGYVPGVTLTKWRRIWAERYRDTLEVCPLTEEAQLGALTEREVDMCFARLPIKRDGLHVIPLYEEQPVAWLSQGHPLAELEEISSEDLEGHNVLTVADAANIELASYAAAILRVPSSIARSGSRRDFVQLPVTHAPTTMIGLAWRIDNKHPLIEEFIGVVRGRSLNSTRGARKEASAKPASAKRGSTRAQSRPQPKSGKRKHR